MLLPATPSVPKITCSIPSTALATSVLPPCFFPRGRDTLHLARNGFLTDVAHIVSRALKGRRLYGPAKRVGRTCTGAFAYGTGFVPMESTTYKAAPRICLPNLDAHVCLGGRDFAHTVQSTARSAVPLKILSEISSVHWHARAAYAILIPCTQ